MLLYISWMIYKGMILYICMHLHRGIKTGQEKYLTTFFCFFPQSGAISSGFRLEDSPFVPYDFMNSSNSPASPPGSIGDGWPRAKSPNGSSSVNWPPGTAQPSPPLPPPAWDFSRVPGKWRMGVLLCREKCIARETRNEMNQSEG